MVHDALLAHPSTGRLIMQVGTGSTNAFATLYDRFSPAVFGAAVAALDSPATAAQATEAAFLGIWRTSPQYAESRDDPLQWLLALVHEGIAAVDRTLPVDGPARAVTAAAGGRHQISAPVLR